MKIAASAPGIRSSSIVCGLALILSTGLSCLPALTHAQTSPSTTAFTPTLALPADMEQALQRARVPASALAVVIRDANTGATLLAAQPQLSMNPASVFKLVTTAAALDLLGPAWAWATPVWLRGPVRDGVLEGNVVIKGTGDPKLVLERVWLLLRRVQQLGVHDIRGDIVLDRSAFEVAEGSPAEFDGEPLRPYNVRADALLLNYKSVLMTFVPDPVRGVAALAIDPPLRGVGAAATVPLASGACGDWRSALKADFSDPSRLRFGGSFAASCGEKQWPVAYADAKTFNARMLEAMWRELGGKLAGTVRDGPAPMGEAPSFEFASPPLSEVVRDINKYSNNVMAQQLFLTLGLVQQGAGTSAAAREVLQRWLAERFGADAAGAVIDNGSGLSRDTRLSAQLIARLLQTQWAGPNLPELMGSLPATGLDGTLRRSKAPPGRAHLKTGSLRDVAAIAGYVLSDTGRRYVVVALINHPNANSPEVRAAFDALVRWTAQDFSEATRR